MKSSNIYLVLLVATGIAICITTWNDRKNDQPPRMTTPIVTVDEPHFKTKEDGDRYIAELIADINEKWEKKQEIEAKIKPYVYEPLVKPEPLISSPRYVHAPRHDDEPITYRTDYAREQRAAADRMERAMEDMRRDAERQHKEQLAEMQRLADERRNAEDLREFRERNQRALDESSRQFEQRKRDFDEYFDSFTR